MYDLTKYQDAIDNAINENQKMEAVYNMLTSKEYKSNEAEAERQFFKAHPELNP